MRKISLNVNKNLMGSMKMANNVNVSCGVSNLKISIMKHFKYKS